MWTSEGLRVKDRFMRSSEVETSEVKERHKDNNSSAISP